MFVAAFFSVCTFLADSFFIFIVLQFVLYVLNSIIFVQTWVQMNSVDSCAVPVLNDASEKGASFA